MVELNRVSEVPSGEGLTTDEGLTPAPHRRDRGLAPLSCRLPLKGGVMDEHGSGEEFSVQSAEFREGRRGAVGAN